MAEADDQTLNLIKKLLVYAEQCPGGILPKEHEPGFNDLVDFVLLEGVKMGMTLPAMSASLKEITSIALTIQKSKKGT